MPPKEIAKRRIEIYLPSLKTRQEWVKAAAKRNLSLSEFVFDVVHTSLSGETGDLRQRASESRRAVEALTTQTADQRSKIEELTILKERYERDLEEYRAQLFLKSDPVSKIDARLVAILAEAKDRGGDHRAVSEMELRKSLRLKSDDIARNKALGIALSFLEAYGMVTKSSKGWTWND